MEEEKKNATNPNGNNNNNYHRRRRGNHHKKNPQSTQNQHPNNEIVKDTQNPNESAGAEAHEQNSNRKRNNYNKKRRHHQNRNIHGAVQTAKESEQDESALDIDNNDTPVELPEDVSTDIKEPQVNTTPAVEKSSVMVAVLGIRFKESGKTYYFDPCGVKAKKGANVIVETARGLEYGTVSLSNTEVSESDIIPPLRPVVRMATEDDKKHHSENKLKEQEAFVTCNERIIAHGLEMKLIDAQYTFDNSKLLFYFSSAGRVDFRALVKDLAGVFKTRIELRQIGIRDEAKLIGGLGLCGRPLCCSRFLSDFGQVSIKMAKEQNLSLNSAKISGACGRLMCCLRYEHETYEYEISRTPPVESTVKTEDGIGTVTEISPLSGMIKVRLADKPDTPPKSYHRDNVTVIKK